MVTGMTGSTGFTEVRTEDLPLLQATAHEFVHRTGARFIHFACEDESNSFAAIIPTTPTNEKGEPHILEHCVLNGSKRYPDAKSVGPIHATGGGAWTGWDYTWYFHSSPSHPDFLKLVDLRCDSLFEPLLGRETFLHQAHHLEFTQPDDPTTPLLYRGVIYNEQKGILGHPVAIGWFETCRALFPGHPYALEHGGTPRDVPTITWEQLKDFHARHYHPSNAYFLSWGDAPLEEILQTLDEALDRVPERSFAPVTFPEPPRLDAPVRYTGRMPIGANDDPTGRTSVLVAWAGADAADPYESLLHDLLVEILRGAPTSPIPAALAASGLSSGVSETFDKYGVRFRRHTVATGLDGADPQNAEAIEQIVLDTIRTLADDGIPDDVVDVALNRIEFRRRTLTGPQGNEGSPTSFWLDLVNTPWLCGGDPLAAAKIDDALERLARERSSGTPLEDRLRAWFVDNPHRALVVIEPDPGADVRLETEERATLDALAAAMSEDEKRAIVDQTKALGAFLEARSAAPAPPDPEKLKSARKEPPEPLALDAAGVHVAAFPTRTNGITYVDLVADIGGLEDELWDFVHLFTSAIVSAGAGGRSPSETEALIGVATGGVDADVFVPVCDGGDSHLRLLRLGGRALERRQDELVSLLTSQLTSATFTPELLRSVVDAAVSHAEQWVFIDAPQYLGKLAGSRTRASSALMHRLDGFAQLHVLRKLAKATDAELVATIDKLVAIRDHVAQRGLLDVCVAASGKEAIDALLPSLERSLAGVQETGTRVGALPDRLSAPVTHEARTFGQPTAFNCQVWAVPARSHPDGAAMVVGGMLAGRHARGEITRKGTAYSASVDAFSVDGTFAGWSIRDPNVARTFAAFEEGIRRLRDGEIDEQELALAKLEASIGGGLSGPPPGRARVAFIRAKAGFDLDAHRRFVEAIDALDKDSLQRAAQEHLSGPGARASLTSAEMAERAGAEGYPFDIITEV
jgi:Zn-dependent M16 (insulinase) family peptidase